MMLAYENAEGVPVVVTIGAVSGRAHTPPAGGGPVLGPNQRVRYTRPAWDGTGIDPATLQDASACFHEYVHAQERGPGFVLRGEGGNAGRDPTEAR